jgi:L-fuculose-phosphate aldolase
MKIPKYEKKMRKQLKKVAKSLGKRGLTSGVRSSVSQRLDPDRYQVTPQGIYLRKTKKKMVVTVDGAGHPIYQRYGWRPSNDLPLHLAAYQARGDVNSIIHAHPPYLSALGLVVDELDSSKLPDSLQILGSKVQVDNLDPEIGETSVSLINALINGNVVLLPKDGVLIVGRSLDDAYAQLDQMEHEAQVYTIARAANLLP